GIGGLVRFSGGMADPIGRAGSAKCRGIRSRAGAGGMVASAAGIRASGGCRGAPEGLRRLALRFSISWARSRLRDWPAARSGRPVWTYGSTFAGHAEEVAG